MSECNICGSSDFSVGYGGRQSLTGRNPCCVGCGSLERHRFVRSLYDAERDLLTRLKVLQFAPDISIDPQWFKRYDGSIYGGENSLDMMRTNLASDSYDIVMSNHVLEHVEDDAGAISESLRLVGDGFVHVNVPLTNLLFRTDDWGYADPNRTFHYRHYGADLGEIMCKKLQNIGCSSVSGCDPVTGVMDQIFFFYRSTTLISQLLTSVQRKNFIVTKIL